MAQVDDGFHGQGSARWKVEEMRTPIFADPGHRRRRLVRVIASGLIGLSLLWLVGFAVSLYFVEKLPQPETLRATQDSVQAPDKLFPVPLDMPAMTDPLLPLPEPSTASCPVTDLDGREVFAFLPYWPEWAYASLRRACTAIDVLMPEWHRVDDFAAGIVPFDADTEHQHYIRELLATKAAALDLFPVITITEAAWRAPEAVTPAELRHMIAEITALAAQEAYDGVCIAPSEVPAALRPAFVEALAALRAELTAAGRQTCLILYGGSGLLEQDGLTEAADRFIWQAFQDPWIGSAPAPLAPQGWFDAMLHEAAARIGPDKLVVALGGFAFDWSSDSAVPERIAFAEAMRRTALHGGSVSFPRDALNTRIVYTDADGARHEIWALDAVSAFNQITALEARGLNAISLWPMGLEDPSVWRIAGAPLTGPQTAADRLAEVRLEDYVGYDGAGPLRRITAVETPGTRVLKADPESGLITGQHYTAPPTPYSIERFGQGAPDTVVLSFDDGPDAEYTPQILDTLKEKNAPALFFLVGRNILQNPDIVRRLVEEGHEIGSHTFFHPQLEAIPGFRTQMELNALQRLLVSLTGQGTILFRTPYGRGEGPLTGEDAQPMSLIDEAGYIVVGSEIVPPDWLDPSAEEIVEHVRTALRAGAGNVIVLHDAGGDRSATVEALPLIIDMLRADGYRVVSLAEMMGVERDALMPPGEGARAAFDGVSFGVLSVLSPVLTWVFWFVIVLGAGRSLTLLVLAHLRRPWRDDGAPYTPSVTVVIPAFNEEAVILNSIETVLASDYPDLKVIVVDDGSHDHTYERVSGAYPGDPRVTVIRESNQGKWMALDTAYAMIDTDIVVAIDADTVITPDAIRRLVRPFRDPRVGAVAGNVKVGNRHNLLTRLQALEYITAQNIDRRAFEVLNAMLVVPGAIGAWRAAAVRAAGLYTNETVTEDADLTVAVIRAGYRVRFQERAFSLTEAPETVRAFLRQRLRWSFGMMQTGWKHRRALREGRAVGLISLPDLLAFGVLLPLLAPFADLVFLGTLADFAFDTLLDRPRPAHGNAYLVMLGYLLLPLMDVVGALLALRFERGESAWMVLLIPFQRFFYRQLLYVTVYRAVYRALVGRLAAWGKLVRLGNVRLPQE